VAVLGPARPESQVEISMTDGRTLGIMPPVRLSGNVKDTPGVVLKGPRGMVTLDHGVIVAKRHVHLNPEDAKQFAVTNGQKVRLQAFTQRPVIFEDVIVRVSSAFADRAHLDFDEANACGMNPGDLGRILS
jgi:propanediol utilization protein